MITILSLMLISISLLSGLIYIIIQIQSNIDQSFSIDYNKKQLDLIVNNLASKTIKNGENYILPEGVNVNGYYSLPDWVSGSNDKSITSIPFLYCPTPNSSGTFNEVVTTKTSTYDIRVEQNSENAGIPYIYHSSLVLGDALAFLISPIGNNQSSPSCEDILFEDGNYFVKGGQLGTLTKNNIKKYDTSFNNNEIISVSPDNASISPEDIIKGDFNVDSLELQLNIFKNNNERELTIYLESGEHVISELNTFISNQNLIRKKITIIGDETGLPVLRHSTNSINMNLKNTDVVLKNVLFKGAIELNNNNIELVNSEVEAIKTNNTNLRLEDVLVTSFDIDAVDLINSDVTLSERIEVNGGVILNGTDVKTNPSTSNEYIIGENFNINSSNVIFSNTNISTNGFDIVSSNVTLDNTNINTNGYDIENKGNLNIKNSQSTSLFTIKNYNNSVLNIVDSFNTLSSIDVEDMNKMSYVSGSASNIRYCTGNIFEKRTDLTLNESGEIIGTTSVNKDNNAQNWVNCNS